MTPLIQAYEEYVKLLEDALSSNVGYLYVHGIANGTPEQIARGKELRAIIAKLRTESSHTLPSPAPTRHLPQ